jgi:hypothetical protein
MSASAMGGDWVAAYLDWAERDDAEDERAAAGGVAETGAWGSEETAAAYLEWIVAVPTARRVLLPDDAETLDALRESMLLAALRTEADYLHILRRVMDAGDAAFPARKLVVDALVQADKLLEDEQRAWGALMGTRDRPLEGVAADVHALAGRLLELQVH